MSETETTWISRHRPSASSSDWLRYGVGLVLAALVAYFTTINAIRAEMAAQAARESARFEEILRRIDVMQTDIRELRTRGRQP